MYRVLFQWAANGHLAGPGGLTMLDGSSFLNATDGFLFLSLIFTSQTIITRPTLQLSIETGAEFMNQNELNLINGMYIGSSTPTGGVFGMSVS